MKKVLSIISVIILCFAMSIPSFAARGSNSICGVNYTNASQFLFNPEGGDLFSNFKGVMPGDNLKQEIVIANQLATKKVTLYLRAEIDEQYKKFLDCIEIEVTLKKGNDDVKSLAKNKASEPGELAKNVNIGTYAPGEKGLLTVYIRVDKNMGNEFKKAVGVIDWIFSAEEGEEITTEKPTKNEPTKNNPTTTKPATEKPTQEPSQKPTQKPSPTPNTGSNDKIGPILGITAGVLGITVLLILNKRKKDSQMKSESKNEHTESNDNQ